MKSHIFSVAVLSALFSAASLAATPQETIARFHAALVAGDKDMALKQLAPDVRIFESGYVERSRDEYANHHLKQDMEFAKRSSSKVIRQFVEVDTKLAAVWEESETTSQDKGVTNLSLGTQTVLLKKSGEDWLIFHIHWSSRKAKAN